MIRGRVVVLSENELPRVTFQLSHAKEIAAQEVRRVIEDAAFRRNRETALSHVLPTIAGDMKLPDVAMTLEVFLALINRYGHLGVSVEEPAEGVRDGRWIYSLPVRFGAAPQPARNAPDAAAPSWAEAELLDPWGSP